MNYEHSNKTKTYWQKFSRIRELRGMKQEALAEAIGLSQQTVSIIEGSEEVELKRLVEIAKILGVTTAAIENFSEESVFNYFNTYYDTKDSVINAGDNAGEQSNNYCTFNPLDKVVELYERLVQVEKEKNEYLDKLLKEK